MDDRTDLFTNLSQLYELALTHVYTWQFLVQIACVFLAIFMARRLASMTINIPDYNSPFLKRLKSSSVITFYELCFYVYLLGIIWIIQSILMNLHFDPWFITLSLITSAIWILGRSSIAMASHSDQARVATFVLWLLILLSLFGNGSSTYEFLKKSEISIAEINISLLFVIESAILFTILLWTAQFLSEFTKERISTAETISPSYKVLYMKISKLALFTLACIIGLSILGIDVTIFAVFSGALGLGLGIGLQRVFANFISGIILLVDKSIKPGDALEVDGARGIVDHMNARYVSVLTYDGKHILIPNESMVTEKVHNWSFDSHKIQMKVNFAVAYGTDLELAQNLVMKILEDNGDIIHTPPPSCLITEFTDTGVKYDIKYWVDGAVARTNQIRNDILMAVWKALKDHKIEIAQTYPTNTYPSEEKPKSTPKTK